MYHLNLENVESRNQENSGHGIMDSGKSVDQENSGATILKPDKSWNWYMVTRRVVELTSILFLGETGKIQESQSTLELIET